MRTKRAKPRRLNEAKRATKRRLNRAKRAKKTPIDKVELSEEGKEEVQRMRQAYDDERPTVALPGTDNTITGVAINEWLDDDGNPKFGKDEQQKTRTNSRNDKDEQQNDRDEQQNDAG